MNKNYRNIGMVAAICLAACNALFGLEIPGKVCFPADRNPLKTAVTNYVLTYLALYAAIPAVSAGAIKIAKGAPLMNSLGAFSSMSRDLATKTAKTMPFAAALAVAYGKYQENMSE